MAKTRGVKMSKLAISGGKPVVPKGLFKEWPTITPGDKQAVMKVLNRGVMWGLNAPEVTAFQKEWAKLIGTKYCLATNSGTSALHIGIAAAGVGPGDEVITSSFSFLSSASSVLHHNGIPVFVDIDPRTFCIDPNKIEEKITGRTKAIIPVHIHGMSADMDEIMAIARKHNLVVIEDACQSHVSKYKGKRTGNIGDMSAFSLNTTKNFAGGEGGLFNTSNEEFRDKADMVRMFGEVVKPGEKRAYNAYGMGWMYRTQEMPAAFARSRMKRLDAEKKIRQQNAKYLDNNLKDIKALITPYVPKDRDHVYHFYRIRVNPANIGLDIDPREFRLKLQMALKAEGVQANEWQTTSIPGQSLFKLKEGYGRGCPWSCPYTDNKDIVYRDEDYPETMKLLNDSFVMHSALYPPNGIKLMKSYADAIHKVFENIDEVLKLDTNKFVDALHGGVRKEIDSRR
jgi:dTDP-4-amino-4,6-dideoxygalactose transaminase